MVDSITGEFPVASLQFPVRRKRETKSQELKTNSGPFDVCKAEQLSRRCLLGLAFSLAFLFSGPSSVLAQPLPKTVAMIGARSGASCRRITRGSSSPWRRRGLL